MVYSQNGFLQNDIAIQLSIWKDIYIMLHKNAGYKIMCVALNRNYTYWAQMEKNV